MLRRLFNLLVLAAAAAGFAYWWIALRPLPLPENPYNFTVRTGAPLRPWRAALAEMLGR